MKRRNQIFMLSDKLSHLSKRGPRAVASRLRAMVQTPRSDGHILMMHNGRSGSTLLGDMMDQHPSIFWDGETFEKFLHQKSAERDIGIDHLYGSFSGQDLIGEIENRIKTRAGNRQFGTEIQDYHLLMTEISLADFAERLRNLGFTKFIYLDRNYMRKIVSHIIATERDQFHVGANAKTKRSQININPEEMYIGHQFTTLTDTLERYKKFSDDATKVFANDDFLQLTYEEHIKNSPTVASEQVCKFLNISVHDPKIKFGKTTNIPLHDVIENYAEIETILKSGPFASQLTNMS